MVLCTCVEVVVAISEKRDQRSLFIDEKMYHYKQNHYTLTTTTLTPNYEP
jgi:hypothetical protein